MDTIASLRRHVAKLNGDISAKRAEAAQHTGSAANEAVEDRAVELIANERAANRLNAEADKLERELENDEQKIQQLEAQITELEREEAAVRQAAIDDKIRLEQKNNEDLHELDRRKREIRG